MESKTHNLWFMVWIRLYWTKMVMDDGWFNKIRVEGV
jgi:hypothetical protein